MDANIAAIATSFCASLIALSCGVRYLLRRCCYPRKEQSLPNYTTQYYIHTANSTQCSRFYFDERNQIRSMVITASIQPNSEQCPQFVGFVLEPSMIEPEHPDPPSPPRYEDALKPVSAPPRYEEQSTGSSSPVRSIDLPPSGRTTARIESSVDEVSSCDGEVEEVTSPRPSRCIRQER
ncbi:hypothetical protein Aduo_016427 [Ancylostoma duodenale]